MRIPLGLAAYQRLDLPPVYLRNLYYERAPANQRDQVALISRPALKRFAAVGTGPIRGLFRKSGVIASRAICLSGNQLFRLDGTPAAATLLGAVEGTGRFSAAGNKDWVFFTAGTKVYRTDGASVSLVDAPDGRAVYAVGHLNGRFLFATTDGRFYWTDPGGLTINALDYATAETKPDDLVGLRVNGDQLWLFGRDSIEPWAPTTNADMPFTRVGGRAFPVGVAARDTLQALADGLYWVGADKRVYRTAPEPLVISDASLEERIGRSDPAILYAFVFVTGGHDFYALQIPGQGTFAYDATTQLWSELTSTRTGAAPGPLRIQVSTPIDEGRTLLGDALSSDVWELEPTGDTDDGAPIVYEWTGAVEGSAARMHVRLDASTGTAASAEADPSVQLRLSTDGGRTWDDWLSEPLGRQGDFEEQAVWSGLGLFRGRLLLQWRTTQRLTVRGADLNEGFR